MSPTRRNLHFGWWSLLGFLSLGMVLEALHGFKVGWYLDVVNETRRLQWTLAHSHGTLIALINLAFAALLRTSTDRRLARASACLYWAGVLMPAGFFLGGAMPFGPDPGFGIVLVPIGGVLLFVGVLTAARVATSAEEPVAAEQEPPPAPRGERRKGAKG